jgi:CheY-like chemotaxis protein
MNTPSHPSASGANRSLTPLPKPGRGEHLLFVDDEEYLTQMGVVLLTRLGYRVSPFNDPQLAFAAFAATPDAFAGLITDLCMPGLNGIDLACRIRGVRPELPVVLATGFSRPHDLARAHALGFGRVLEKPFTLEKFVEALLTALRPHEPRTK